MVQFCLLIYQIILNFHPSHNTIQCSPWGVHCAPCLLCSVVHCTVYSGVQCTLCGLCCIIPNVVAKAIAQLSARVRQVLQERIGVEGYQTKFKFIFTFKTKTKMPYVN